MILKYRLLSWNEGLLLAGLAAGSVQSAYSQKQPNVILILTDDQGYGDLGITGNPNIKTPVIDNLARESIRFNKFYVSPVSAPTRSSLLTGRYSLRTGIRDTYNGGAIMSSSEVTIAEILASAGYKTGVFGKWHLGDNYPSRPNDQGFAESLTHLSGGMGQPGDITTYFRKDSSYFDPVLWHNGKQEKFAGYCSDIFATAAINFIEKNNKGPFFCYLAFNAPHTPLQVPEKYYKMYKDVDPLKGIKNDLVPQPAMTENNKEDARKVYAMVANIDENIGRILKKLDELRIADNTVVIFMTDNGPQQRRYVAGMHGLKGSVYNGGVRVPFYIRYPALFKGNKDIDVNTAHIDVLPTLAEICNVELPKETKIDGMSLLPLITGKSAAFDERSLFFYWTRHNPELYNNIAIIKGKYKLVGQTDYNAGIEKFELYDLEKDWGEKMNIVKASPAIANTLKVEMDGIFRDLTASENLLNPPCIEVGTVYENPVILNRNDADGDRGIWEQEEIFGKWNVSINKGYYNIRFKFLKPVPPNGRMMVETGSRINTMKNTGGSTDLIEMKNVYLPEMKCDFIPFYEASSKRIFPFFVELEKVEK